MELLYFAFPNSSESFLPQMKFEYDAVRKLITPGVTEGYYKADWDAYFDSDKMVSLVADYSETLFLFHYSGHAGKDALEPNDDTLNAKGVISLLGNCENLKLVVLNGCSTKWQVERLLKAGVPIVIATSGDIEDRLAANFSSAFYKALSKDKTIEQAFEIGKGAVELIEVEKIEFRRGIGLEDIGLEDPLWGIFYEEKNAQYLHLPLPRGPQIAAPNSQYWWENLDIPRVHFKNWIRWGKMYPKFEKYEFQTTTQLDEYVNEIHEMLKKENSSLRIIGLSGLGKTRIVYEAFQLERIEHLDSKFHFGLLYIDVEHEIQTSLIQYVNHLCDIGKEGVLVVDNCPQQLHHRLKINLQGTNIRLLTISSLHEDIEAYHRGDLMGNIIFLSPDDYRPIIAKVLYSIDPSLPEDALKRLQDLAGGFPLIATLLANDKIENNPQLGRLNDNELAKRLLGIPVTDTQTLEVLKICSIFEKFGFYEELESDIDKISNSEALLLTLDSQPGKKTATLFFGICKKFAEIGIFEKTGRYISLKPKPLALWLASDWWRKCRSETVIQLLQELSDHPLSVALCDQMKYLDFLSEAREITEELCGHTAPFGQAEVLNSPNGSRLFRSLIEVNPEATLDALWRVFRNWDTEQLKSVGPGRRNLIWGLEKLCFRKDLFDQAAKLMFKFAVAETENFNNNATGQFLHLFQISLPGTEADLNQRINLFKYGISHKEKRYQELALAAMERGLQADGFRRFIGGEIIGNSILEDYKPKSLQEILNYWETILDHLIGFACSNHEFSELSKKVIPTKIRGLCYHGGSDLMLNAVQRIHEYSQDEFWEEALRELKITLKYEKNRINKQNKAHISELIQVLSPVDIPSKYKQIVVESSWFDVEDYAVETQQEHTAKRVNLFLEEIYPEWKKYFELFFSPSQYNGDYFGMQFAKRFITDKGGQGIERFQNMVIDFLEQQEDFGEIGFTVLYGFHKGLEDQEIRDRFIRLLSQNDKTRSLVFAFASRIPVSKDLIWGFFELVDTGAVDLAGFLAFRFTNQFESNIEDLLQFCEKIASYGVTGGWVALIILHGYYFNSNDRFDQCREVLRKILLMENLWISKEKRRYSSTDEMAWQTPATELLEDNQDHKLAGHISKEIGLLVQKQSVGIVPYEQFIKPVLKVLLRDFFDNIWPVIAEGLLTKEMLNWRGLVGSDKSFHGYSPGILFEYGDHDKILEWCTSNLPEGALAIALMMPKVNSNEEETELHPFTRRMIDEFGNLEGFMMRFDNNISTYGSVGSVVPTFQRKRKMIEQLKDHPYPEVQAWAREYLASLERQIRLERNWEEERYN